MGPGVCIEGLVLRCPELPSASGAGAAAADRRGSSQGGRRSSVGAATDAERRRSALAAKAFELVAPDIGSS
jgi:hypothetical protein